MLTGRQENYNRQNDNGIQIVQDTEMYADMHNTNKHLVQSYSHDKEV